MKKNYSSTQKENDQPILTDAQRDEYRHNAKEEEKDARTEIRTGGLHPDKRWIYKSSLEAGELRMSLGEYNSAEIDYKQALKYAPTWGSIERIKALLYKIKNKKDSISIEKKVEEPNERKRLFEPGFWDRVLKPNTPNNMQDYMFAILSVASLLGALFFVSANVTGYAVLGVNAVNSRIWGICFFICGLMFTFLYLKSKNKF